jgi:hypothetical protein
MNQTPVIEKIDNQNIRWVSPTFASLVTRTVEIFKDNTLYRTDTLQGSGSLQINNLVVGVYKIRYTVNSNSEPVSDFSNEITLDSTNCDFPDGIIQADKTSYNVGENAILSSSGLVNYTALQWFKNGGIISGENSSTLTLSSLALANNGDVYELYIENNCGGGKTTTSNLTNEIILNVQAVSNSNKTYFVCSKMDSACQSEIIQFGYSSTQVVPSVWVDADLTKMLISTGGVTSEVQSGGENYQVKSFVLQAGTYYFYARQKTETTNIVFIGSLTVTN